MEEDTIKLPEWKNLVECAKEWEYGTVHSHTEIAAILRLKYSTSAYKTAVSRANEELTPLGKRLKNIRNVGYEVLKPDSYLSESVLHVNKASREIKRGVSISYGCKLELVSPEKRQDLLNFREWVRSKFVDGVSDVSNWMQVAKESEHIPKLPMRK